KRIEKLRDAGHLTPHFAEIRLIMTEQNCAEINTSVVHDLAKTELEDATRLQREGMEKQRQLAETGTIEASPTHEQS
ncbi:MAG TPA: hypothetical protein VI685_21260, partial [Candidatus Angelobacter sp.]